MLNVLVLRNKTRARSPVSTRAGPRCNELTPPPEMGRMPVSACRSRTRRRAPPGFIIFILSPARLRILTPSIPSTPSRRPYAIRRRRCGRPSVIGKNCELVNSVERALLFFLFLFSSPNTPDPKYGVFQSAIVLVRVRRDSLYDKSATNLSYTVVVVIVRHVKSPSQTEASILLFVLNLIH